MSDYKRKSVITSTVVDLYIHWEFSLFKYIDTSMPNKFKPTMVRQLINDIGGCRRLLIIAMDLPMDFIDEKYHTLSQAHAELRNIEVTMNHLNDMQSISDEAKSRFDMSFADIYGNIERLLNSFAQRIQRMRQVPEGTPTGENSRDKGCLTNIKDND